MGAIKHSFFPNLRNGISFVAKRGALSSFQKSESLLWHPRMITSGSKIAALVVTYRRPALLTRLMKSLVESNLPPDLVLIWDNGGEAATADVAAQFGLLARYVASPENLGVGGGIAAAIGYLRKNGWEDFQYLWLLDDDAEVEPECLEALAAAATATRAALHVPLIEDGAGRLAWLPGIRNPQITATAKKRATAEDLRNRFSTSPMPIDWATGQKLLASAGNRRPDCAGNPDCVDNEK